MSTAALTSASPAVRSRGRAWRRFRRHRLALLGAAAILLMVLASIVGPWLIPFDQLHIDIRNRFAPPLVAGHLFGTDQLGRDLLARLLMAGRISLTIGFAAMVVSTAFGTIIGITAGYYGKAIGAALMRFVDAMLCFPQIFLLLVLAAFVQPGVVTLTLIVAAISWMEVARVVQSQIRSLRERDFILAAEMLGASGHYVMFRELLPNAAGPIVVAATLTVARAILMEAYVGFLGYGIQPPLASWGNMLNNAQQYLGSAPWLAIFPGLMIALAVTSFNFVGDGLRDALDAHFDLNWGRTMPILSVQSPRPLTHSPTNGAAPAAETVLDVRSLSVTFATGDGPLHAVCDVSFQLRAGETLALVGESGSGKSVTSLAIMRLMPAAPQARIGGSVLLTGGDGLTRDLLTLDPDAMRMVRGNEISMIFQEPMTSLNPVHRIGDQIAEAIVFHQQVSPRAAMSRAEELLDKVGIPDGRQRLAAYPHHLSGGMRQRVMIAMALACNPRVLIADEPTTALDVTVQAQILELLKELQRATGMAVIFVTHNLGVVAEIADRVTVMYAGRIVEKGDVVSVMTRPLMPYTQGLLRSVPLMAAASLRLEPLEAIPGSVPDPVRLPPGCAFAPRCRYAEPACDKAVPPLDVADADHQVRCRRWPMFATEESWP